MLRIRVLGYLIGILGFHELKVKLDQEMKLSELVPELMKVKGENIIVLVNGRSTSIDCKVKDGDEVVIAPIIGGG